MDRLGGATAGRHVDSLVSCAAKLVGREKKRTGLGRDGSPFFLGVCLLGLEALCLRAGQASYMGRNFRTVLAQM